LSGHVCGFSPGFTNGLTEVSVGSGSASSGFVEVSRQIWYEHIVAAARPSTNPCSYGV
jgi:hypothetical protein